MSNYIINTNTNQLTFLDGRFYRTESGQFVPSVTTILEAYPKPYAYYQWLKENGNDSDRIRNEAGERGSTVHKLTERYDAGEEIELMNELGYIGYKLEEWEMLNRYVEFIERFDPGIILSEQNFISDMLGYAGTIDRIMLIEGKTYLVDIKTSNAIYDSYWLQLSAYHKLYCTEFEHYHFDGIAILWLNAKTRTEGKKGDIQGKGWQLIIKDEWSEELDLFNHTHKLWLAQNKNYIPKQTSYKLKIKKSCQQ